MGKKVMTVTGEIDAGTLGFTDIHEHILIDASFYAKRDLAALKAAGAPIPDTSYTLENMADQKQGIFALSAENFSCLDYNEALFELKKYKELGGESMVEVTPFGLRVDIRQTKRLSEESGIKIITATGVYAEGAWKEWEDLSVDELSKKFIEEITVGIEGTDIKAGIIKAAGNAMTELEKKAIKAGAKAQKATGRPMAIHTGAMLCLDDTLEMVRIALSEDIEPDKLIMCHMDQNLPKSNKIVDYINDFDNTMKLNLDQLKRIMDQGVNISFDCFGCNYNLEKMGIFVANDYDRLRALISLIKDGYGDKIMLGSDVFLQSGHVKQGGCGYTRLHKFAIPTMQAAGVSDSDIEKLTILNPARYLGV